MSQSQTYSLKEVQQRGNLAEAGMSRAPHNYPICYLEAKNDGPDETQGETVIPIHNVMWTHVF